MNNILIAYFSASGITKEVAKKVNDIVNGDLFEIEPVEKYTNDDLDWNNSNSRSTIEMKNKEFRPPIKSKVENMELYDKVVLGFPVWWYTAPTIINTFIEGNNLEGKDIYIFVTSGSSLVDDSFNDLKNTYPNLSFISGKRFTLEVDTDEVLEWLSNS